MQMQYKCIFLKTRVLNRESDSHLKVLINDTLYIVITPPPPQLLAYTSVERLFCNIPF